MLANFKPIITGYEKNNGNVGETFNCPIQNTPNSGEIWNLTNLFIKLQLRAIPKLYLNVTQSYGWLSEVIFQIDRQIIALEKKVTKLEERHGALEGIRNELEEQKRAHVNSRIYELEAAAKQANEAYTANPTHETARELYQAEAEIWAARTELAAVNCEVGSNNAERANINAEIAATEAEIASAKSSEYQYRTQQAQMGLAEIVNIYNALKFITVSARLVNKRTGEVLWLGNLKLAEKPVGNLRTEISSAEVEKKVGADLRSYYYEAVEYTAEELHSINVPLSNHEEVALEISVNPAQNKPTNGSGVEPGNFKFGNTLEVLGSEITSSYTKTVTA